MAYTPEWGSKTARGGFKIEDMIGEMFKNWKKYPDAKKWLKKMDYGLDTIEEISINIPKQGRKADVILKIKIEGRGKCKVEKISVKKVNGNYNQVDKRDVDSYVKMFNLSEKVKKGLKKMVGEENYTPPDLVEKGELKASELDELYDYNYSKPEKPRRLAFTELKSNEKQAIIDELSKKKEKIIRRILAGKNEEVDWFLVVRAKKDEDEEEYEAEEFIFESIEETISRLSKGEVRPSPRGSSIRMGKVTIQRKGGTPVPTKLQFKINPWPS